MQIKNARVYTNKFVFENKNIFVKNGKFTESADPKEKEIYDAKDLLAIPGLIDIHFHGSVGCDFMDGNLSSLSKIAAYQASCGITSICPATMTMSEDRIHKACVAGAEFVPNDKQAELVGINMEGPFVSPNKVGAQNPKYVIKSSAEFFRRAQNAAKGLIKLLAIAPEEDGAIETIKALKDEVLCSIAHTTTNYDIAKEAIASGATHITHLYNAMPPLHHRDPGPIAAGADAKDCDAEIICDGVHIHPAAVRAAFKLFTKDRMILISDSMMAVGLEDGEYELGGQKVIVKGRLATLESGTIAGSATNLYDCMKTSVQKMEIPLEDAIKCATYNPARSIGILDKAGSIEDGKKADLLLVDQNLNLKAVLLRGKWLKFDL